MNMGQIGNLLDRPKLYNNIDGVGEFGIGFMMLAFALFFSVMAQKPEGSVWHQRYVRFAFLLVVTAIVHYGSKAIKNRVTYPRTGFVQYRRRDTLWLPLVLGVIVGGSTVITLGAAIRWHWNLTTPASLVGLIFAATYAYCFARTARWKWAVVAVLVAGSLVIALLPANLVGALAIGSPAISPSSRAKIGAFLLSIMLYGTALLVSGGITFWLYLRRTQPPARETQ